MINLNLSSIDGTISEGNLGELLKDIQNLNKLTQKTKFNQDNQIFLD